MLNTTLLIIGESGETCCVLRNKIETEHATLLLNEVRGRNTLLTALLVFTPKVKERRSIACERSAKNMSVFIDIRGRINPEQIDELISFVSDECRERNWAYRILDDVVKDVTIVFLPLPDDEQ